MINKENLLFWLLLLFSQFSFSQNEADSVIIAIQKERLTKQELIEFDSLKSTMYNLDEVHYFRRIYRHISELNRFYHLSCTSNVDSIFNVLNRKTLFDTVFYDHPSLPCCDSPVYATDPLDTTYVQNLIDLPCAWDISTGDTAIKIGIIDKHFYQNSHEDIVDKVNCMYGPYYGDKRDSFLIDEPDDPPLPHGLFMSGLISAKAMNGVGISGISNILKFNGYLLSDTEDSYLHTSEIHNAIENATFEQEEKILNISYHSICLSDFGGVSEYYDSIFYQNIVNNGTFIVTAAGNERNSNIDNKHQIFDIPGVIVVGAVNNNNKVLVDHPQYQCNPYMGICAPGIGIMTTHWENGESSYVYGNGTSSSAAIVSGVVGLMLSVDSTLTPPEIEHILKTSADSIADFDEANDWVSQNYNGTFNAGSLNAYHAVYKAKHFNECTPSYIQTGQNITWNDTTYCSDSLIVEGTLTITAPVHLLTNLPHITIQNGGHLVFDTGSELFHWEDENYAGNINVEAGSTLEFKNGSDIVLAENGKIMVNHDANNTGELIFNNGASLTLLDDNTNLEIAGDLHIASNATFTFTGDGYIKFSNPGGDATNNIFCGSGASIVLQGSGQTDKIMEVQQSSVRFPADLSNLELRDGKIEMGQNKRMLAEGSPAITFDNIKITSDIPYTNNNHRSFFFWGQPNITINNCVFEYGQYGLYNYTYGGAALSVTNSEFNHNQTGLYMYDKGLTLDNCDFNNNTLVGLHADNMSWTSALENCNFQYNNDGIDYHGSAGADLNLSHSTIQNSTDDGVKTDGSFDLKATCTNINDNQNGIYTEAGTRVRIDRESKNNFSGNVNAIYLDYGTLAAKYGKNNLQSTNYAVLGETPMLCAPPLSPELEADYNLWDGTNSPAYLQNHKLWVLNCNQVPVNITDPNPQAQMCGFTLNMSPSADSQDTDIQLSDESTSGSLTSQVDAAYEATSALNTATECQQLLSESITLMENVYGIETAEAYYQSNRIWSIIHNIIDKHYEIIGRENENPGFNQSVDQVMQLNEQLMLDADAISYYEYALDNALLERLRGNFDEALLLLDLLIPELEGMERETSYVNRWACHIEAEREAAMGNLSPDEFMAAIETCNASYENSMENLPDASENETGTETPAPEIHIVPNPNNGNFTVEISECTAGSSLRISNLYAQPVYTQTFTESGPQTVQVAGLAQGQYTVYYLENDVVISSANVIVE